MIKPRDFAALWYCLHAIGTQPGDALGRQLDGALTEGFKEVDIGGRETEVGDGPAVPHLLPEVENILYRPVNDDYALRTLCAALKIISRGG